MTPAELPSAAALARVRGTLLDRATKAEIAAATYALTGRAELATEARDFAEALRLAIAELDRLGALQAELAEAHAVIDGLYTMLASTDALARSQLAERLAGYVQRIRSTTTERTADA
jgi:hypothetical protein